MGSFCAHLTLTRLCLQRPDADDHLFVAPVPEQRGFQSGRSGLAVDHEPVLNPEASVPVDFPHDVLLREHLDKALLIVRVEVFGGVNGGLAEEVFTLLGSTEAVKSSVELTST